MSKIAQGKPFHVLLIALSGVLWGTIGLYTTFLNRSGLDAVSITAVRAVLTAAFLGVFLLFTRPALFRIRLRDLWCFFGMGVVSFAFFNICYFNSMRYNSIGTACILLYTAPVFVMILSAVLFRERLTGKKLICLLLAVCGCALVSGIGGGFTLTGFLFGIGSGFGYALYSIFGVYALKRNHFFTSIFYAFVCAAVCLLPFCKWGQVVRCVQTDIRVLFYLLAIAVFTTVLPYILYTKGLRGVPAGEASVVACVEPLVANLLGIFVFSETPTAGGIVGIVLILAAVVVLGIGQDGRTKKAVS